jgi:putative tryptophan/tyrosine transport system substrate-binding protein
VRRRHLLVLPFVFTAVARGAEKLLRIGYLSGSTAENDAPLLGAFRHGMSELGYEEGMRFVLEERYFGGREASADALALELVRSGTGLFLAYGSVAAFAAQKAAPQTPVVLTHVADPVGVGLVASLARPGGNVTGLSDFHYATVVKRLELLKHVRPTATRLGILFNNANPHNPAQVKELLAHAPAVGVALVLASVTKPGKIETAMAGLLSGGVDGVLFVGDTMLSGRQTRLAALALDARLPAIYGPRSFAEAGGLLAYGADFPAMWKRAASFVDRIAKGARPADLPIEQPTSFRFVINLKTAKALGLDIAPTLLARADEVIE